MPQSEAFYRDDTNPPEKVSNESLLDIFGKLASSPKNATRLKKALVHNKPDHWNCKSNAPYYREIFAKLAQKILDRILETGREQIYYYHDWPNTKPVTLYSRFHQGKNYLIDHMDPDGKYASLCQALSIERRRGVGIIIGMRKDIIEIEKNEGRLDMLMPKELINNNQEWRDKMENWLESATIGIPFIVEGLALAQEDIDALMLELNELPNVCGNITTNKIKLIKTE